MTNLTESNLDADGAIGSQVESEGEAIQELPQGWVSCTLEDCTNILDSMRKPVNNKERQARIAGKSEDELFPYFGATGQAGYIDDYLFNGEYVALGEDGVPFFDPKKHKAYLLKGKTWVNNHAHVLQGSVDVNNKFICHQLNQTDYHGYVNGATRLKLTQQNMRRLPFLLPPSNEQTRIANKLDQLLARVDVAQARLNSIPSLLKRFRQSVLVEATSGRLTEAWSESNEAPIWAEKPLQEIANSISDGDHQAPPKSADGIPFLVISNINKGFINFDRVTRWVPDDYFNNLKEVRVPRLNDILYTVTGSYGIPVIVNTEKQFCFQRHVAIIKPNHDLVDHRYLYIVLGSNHVLEQAHTLATGTAQKTVSLKSLRGFNIPVPSLLEQTEIVRRVESLFALADTVEKQCLEAKLRTDRLTQSILAKAFRGELVPQDPNDEPAEQLLAQIQLEREQALLKVKPNKKIIKRKAVPSAKATPKQSNSPLDVSIGDVDATLKPWLDKKTIEQVELAAKSLSGQSFTVEQLKNAAGISGSYEEFRAFVLQLLKGVQGQHDPLLELEQWIETSGDYRLRLKGSQ